MDMIAVTGTSATADGTGSVADRVRVPLLTEVLFDGRFDELHRPWTELFGRNIFRYRDGLSPSERSELAYERLRTVNEQIESVEELVTATIVRDQDCGVFLFLVPLRDERGPLPGIRVRPLTSR
ncbi:hypothetical protein AB0G77_39875 [Streptomyces hygroscopicus]|uniref:hypothetical protein n=1 Tax=Streptomyces hygroscopicus TaxID=1912 RepID=UPI0033FFBE30